MSQKDEALKASTPPKAVWSRATRTISLTLLVSSALGMGKAPRVIQDPQRFEQYWKRCQENAECVPIEGSCGEPECVNRRYEREAKRFYEETMPFIECMPSEPKQAVEAVCQDSRCACQAPQQQAMNSE